MGTKNLVMLKTHIGSINLCFANDFVYENMLWVLASLRVFFTNYVLYSLWLMLRYIFRFHVEDKKNEHLVPVAVADQAKRNHFEDSEIKGFTEELANLIFPSSEDSHVASEEREGETESSVLNEKDPDIFIETVSDVYKNVKKIDEKETESSVFMEGDSNDHQYGTKRVEEVQEEKDEAEEPTTMTFTFREIYTGANVSDNTFSSTENIATKEFSQHILEEGLVAQEEKDESVQEQRTFASNSTSGFVSNAFGASDSSDDDYLLYSDNLLQSDSESESESSSSSDLIWGSSNNIDDSLTCQNLQSNNSCKGFESESLKVIKDERVEDVEETQFSCDVKVSHGEEAHKDCLEKTEEIMWEDDEDSYEDDEDDDDFDWENDEVVEQLKLELRNARQGGLATILEEEGDEETEPPKVVEDLKPLRIEEKIEYKDHIVEIQKVYRSYAEKIRKLDILNYQTMHAIGLLQLKDPLKLMLIPKSTVQHAKPSISQNLWPRKAQKHKNDPMLKFVHELHRDLELVYVGQVCLSWEILCWQHKKVHELKQYDSQWPRRYNLVADEFQLFQVLMQRFIEDEPFQGPRIQNYVKNRCVIRKLLQVPAIKDDNNKKDKKIVKWGDEDAITSERLEQIIKESMQVFWEFVKADKDYGNAILKVSHQTGIDVKDPAISDLLGDIRTELQKKERKLKDLVRSGNCIVRKFQKHHDDQIQLDIEQLLAQVGLRLISRVVNMKKLRKDQLIWCNEKLNRIEFVGRKIQVEPFFLLFPC
ncbi:uncharacterized protein LOC133302792 [Gastrolobium bilobum]|uniref:uncharacterized protein LOC133302792 n=1 Tax=Gastrolobium bilobum TaxID=150636 RepID=UPI002AB1C706|nr:uncharacterized protein LOC133302792 [Gastrolobium bilobum]